MIPATLVSQVPPPLATAVSVAVSVPAPKIHVSPSQKSGKGSQGKPDYRQSNSVTDGSFPEILSAAMALPPQTEVRYSIDKETGIVSFKVIDPLTKEVIRQIPSEEIVSMARRLKQTGLILDSEA